MQRDSGTAGQQRPLAACSLQLAARRKAARRGTCTYRQGRAGAGTSKHHEEGAGAVWVVAAAVARWWVSIAGAVRVRSGEGEMECWGISGEGKPNGSTRLGLSSASCGFVANRGIGLTATAEGAGAELGRLGSVRPLLPFH